VTIAGQQGIEGFPDFSKAQPSKSESDASPSRYAYARGLKMRTYVRIYSPVHPWRY
jgi:hypothetical protein